MNTWPRDRIAPLALAVALALLLGGFAHAVSGAKVGEPFPALSKFGLEGTLPDHTGKVVLIDFWASWCAPCQQSFPALNELHQRYGSQEFVIIAINVDEKRAKMEAFLKNTPAKFAVVRDPRQKLVAEVDVQTMPASFLLDRSGRVRFTHNGYNGEPTKKAYVQQIEELLKSK